MKNFAFSFIVLLGSALALTPGCGDDENNNGPAAGSGGTAGDGGSTSKGGSTGKGGTQGGAGESSSAGGEPAAGGTPAEGGSPTAGGGMPGAGGAGFMNPAGCPEAAPATNDDCSISLDRQTSCEYAGSRCVCNGFMGGGGAGGAGPAGSWICRGAGADCPDPAPTTGDMCDTNNMRCPYPGGNDCVCQGGDWACGGPDTGPGQGGAPGVPAGECPATEPEPTTECAGPIPSCFYDDTNTLCTCPSNGQGANEWGCETF